MPNAAAELAEILGKVNRPGDFFVSGRGEFLMPRLEVADVGPIALPLLPLQARALIEAATRAPYGRGQDTIVDETVRRTWQIEASRVTLGGKAWPKTLAEIVAKAAEGLGVEGPVAAELYKLLIHDEGSPAPARPRGPRRASRMRGPFTRLPCGEPAFLLCSGARRAILARPRITERGND